MCWMYAESHMLGMQLMMLNIVLVHHVLNRSWIYSMLKHAAVQGKVTVMAMLCQALLLLLARIVLIFSKLSSMWSRCKHSSVAVGFKIRVCTQTLECYDVPKHHYWAHAHYSMSHYSLYTFITWYRAIQYSLTSLYH